MCKQCSNVLHNFDIYNETTSKT